MININLHLGIVEDRNDPEMMGRCRCRIIGFHPHDKIRCPTKDLPWATPMNSISNASMNGIGNTPLGPVEGTTVVLFFIDPQFEQHPIMLGTIGNISKRHDSLDNIVPELLVRSERMIEEMFEGEKNDDDIPVTPPPGSTPNISAASQGIQNLLEASEKVGLTTKEQKCALLGIIGGETLWVPQQESYHYSPERMREVFSFVPEEGIQRYSEAFSKGLTREDFFSYVYGTTLRPENPLGNLSDDDGGNFYGRGYIQLTGRYNYERMQRLLRSEGFEVDIVNNPDLINSDPQLSALVAALYFKDRVSASISPASHPGYYYASKRAVGYNTSDISRRKDSYYSYFYGNLPNTRGEKNVTTTRQGIPDDQVGFKDPNNKYPLEDYENEPHLSRNARGWKEGTNYNTKISTRQTNVSKPFSLGNWNQPQTPYDPRYPFNHVRESESGHVEEWDDTPGAERISVFHKSGTYTETGPDGTQVNYINGDKFTIVEQNGNVRIQGECNISVNGDINLITGSNANIEIHGQTNILSNGNVQWKINGDMALDVGGSFSLDAKSLNLNTDGDFRLQADSSINMNSSGRYVADFSELRFGNDAVKPKKPGEVNINFRSSFR